MRKLNQRGMANIRRAVAVMHALARRAHKHGSVSGYACGCSRDCGFARFTESTPPTEAALKILAKPPRKARK